MNQLDLQNRSNARLRALRRRRLGHLGPGEPAAALAPLASVAPRTVATDDPLGTVPPHTVRQTPTASPLSNVQPRTAGPAGPGAADLRQLQGTRLVATALIGITGAESGRIIGATRSLADLLGRAADDLPGMLLSGLIHPDDRAPSLYERVRHLGRSETSFHGVLRLLSAADEVRWVNVHSWLTPANPRPRLLIRAAVLPLRLVPVRDAGTGEPDFATVLDATAARAIAG
jgi:PAS domain-containing protein